MGFTVAVARAGADTGGGTQDITSATLGGLTPKSAILLATWAVTNATDTDHASACIGFTDGTNHAVVATMDEHNLSESDNIRRATSDEVIMILDPANSDVQAEANFSAWITDGIRINW